MYEELADKLLEAELIVLLYKDGSYETLRFPKSEQPDYINRSIKPDIDFQNKHDEIPDTRENAWWNR